MDGSSRSTHSALTELTELMGVSTGVAGVLDAADLHLGAGLVAGFATMGNEESRPQVERPESAAKVNALRLKVLNASHC